MNGIVMEVACGTEGNSITEIGEFAEPAMKKFKALGLGISQDICIGYGDTDDCTHNIFLDKKHNNWQRIDYVSNGFSVDPEKIRLIIDRFNKLIAEGHDMSDMVPFCEKFKLAIEATEWLGSEFHGEFKDNAFKVRDQIIFDHCNEWIKQEGC
jgi:hypothetical protein